MDKKLIALIASPFIAIIFSIIIASSIKFKPILAPIEQEVAGLSFEKAQIIQRKPLAAAALDSPFGMPDFKKGYPPVPLQKIAPQETGEDIKVTLILIGSKRKMAIINSMVVNEGDPINNYRVAKIEKNRVLIKDRGGERWIRVE